MLVNYLLNVVVIGIPSARGSALKLTVISRDLVLFTILPRSPIVYAQSRDWRLAFSSPLS